MSATPIYTDEALQALVAAITLESLIITASLMTVSMFLGAIVQRAVKFIWPTDIVTIILAAFMLIQLLGMPSKLVIAGIESIWWIPVIIGYIVGYIVIGRAQYVMIRRITDDKSFETVPWVIYHIDGKPYRQEQKNRALLKRLLFGIHHEILCPHPIDPNYDDKTKYPGFPTFNRKMVCTESYETYEIMPKKPKRRIYLKRHATKVTLAYGSAVSKYELHRNVSALEKANSNLIEAENKIHALNQSVSVRMADTVAAFLAKVYSRAPGAVFKDAVAKWRELEEEEDVQKEKESSKKA